MKKLALLVLAVLLLLPLFSACTEEMPAPPESGYSVSGIVLLDGEPLAGVSVWSGGEVVGSTDENGVYSVSGLSKYSSVAFEKEGYSFSPASYTVTGDANDYNVVASVVSPPPEDEPDDPSEPDGPDVPDLPDLPDEPDEPDAPDAEPLSVPTSFFAAYSSSGAFTVGFSADIDTESLSFVATSGELSLTAQADIRAGVLPFDGAVVPFDATVTEDRLEVTMDVTALAERLAGEFPSSSQSPRKGWRARSPSLSCVPLRSRLPASTGLRSRTVCSPGQRTTCLRDAHSPCSRTGSKSPKLPRRR